MTDIHPPIPPNCTCWFEVKNDPNRNGLWFSPFAHHHDTSTWSHDESFPWDFSNPDLFDAEERRIIACVARCAWLDEAERWAKTPVNDGKNFDAIAGYKAEAEANAEAWRKWGENA